MASFKKGLASEISATRCRFSEATKSELLPSVGVSTAEVTSTCIGVVL